MAANDAGPGKDDQARSPRRASWRGSATATASPSDYRWRDRGEKTNREVAQQNLRRRVKLALLTSSVLGLCGAFAWYWLMRPRATPLLAVSITQYVAPLPPNSFAAEDVTRLSEVAKAASRGSGMLTVKSSPTAADGSDDERAAWNSKSAESLLKQVGQWLEGATPGGPGRRMLGSGGTVVLYITGHGAVDEKGRACIIPADAAKSRAAAEPAYLKSDRWLAVADVVQRLDEIRPDVKKLLVLDCNRLDADWAIGLLYNGFAEALPAARGNAKSVAILSAAQAGQLAWPGVELQGTPFGFYLSQALIGDPAADDDRNGKISLQELARFVRTRVSNWVRANRYDDQLPLLVPEEADFDVAYNDLGAVDVVQPPDAAKIQSEFNELQPLWSQLDDLWREHERLQGPVVNESSPVWSEHCLDWHRFQQELVRCGSLLLAGREYRDECGACLSQLKGLAQKLSQRRQEALPVPSLPLARRWRKLPIDPSLREEVAGYLQGEKKSPSSEVKGDYFVRADGVWQWLATGRAPAGQDGRDAGRRAVDFVDAPAPPDKYDVVEIRLLKLLADHAPDSLWNQADKQLLPVLKLRESAEEAAAPRDVRAHYALRRRVERADADLRRLEDALFINDDVCKQAGPCLARKQDYESAQRDGERLAEILAKRDQAWAEFPYLAQWLLRRPDTLDGGDVEAIGKISETIASLRDLDVRLDAYLEGFLRNDVAAAGQEETLEELEFGADRVDGWRRGVGVKLQDAVDRAVVKARDEVTLRQLVSLLASPLVSGHKRIALRRQYSDALQKPLASAGTSAATSTTGTSTPPTESGDDNVYLRRLTAGDHPALALVGWEAITSKEPDSSGKQAAEASWLRLARQGGDVRQRLLELASVGVVGPQPVGDDAEPAPARSVYSFAERRLRPAAALCASAEFAANDPIDRLARFDLNEFLAWRAERTLDDFWGSGDEDRPAKPYFALVFDELRDAARKLGGADQTGGNDLQARWSPLKDRAQQLVAAAEESGLAKDRNDVSRAPGTTFQRKVPMIFTPQLPPGEAALFVLDGDKRPVQARRTASDQRDFQARLPVSTAGQKQPQTETTIEIRRGSVSGKSTDAEQEGSGRPWSVVWFYRGHRKARPFNLVVEREGIEIVYQRRAQPVDTTVTVTGDDLKEASIVFILDCSGSMGEPDAGGGARRIDVARNTLDGIIEDLSRTQRLRVGLWLYGHRLGRLVAGGPVAINPNWQPPPANLPIGNDVEQVIPLVLLDNAAKREFQNKLRGAKPWGETPLYMAIVEAMKPFHWPAGSGARHLVVITDGKNDVTQQQPRILDRQLITAMQADKQNKGRQPIKLHVLDCTPLQNAELRGLLANNRLGQYIAVDKWQKLEQTLKDALGLAEYELRSLDPREARTLGPEPLGKPLVVPGPFLPDLSREYEVRVLDRPALARKVKLEGEEALRLSVERRGKQEQLVFERYEPEGQYVAEQSISRKTPNVVPLGAADDEFRPVMFDIAAYSPQWEGGAAKSKRPLRFAISIQDAGDPPGFSPRPAEAWVEITPLAAQGAASGPYPFYDLLFEEERPVPVLLCRVPQWPVAARDAEIRLWFKFDHMRPSKEVVIGKMETPVDETQELVIPGAPALRLGVQTADEDDGCRLVVTEEHPPEDAAADWLRVQTLEPPDRVVRTFSYSGRSATHVFYFHGRPRSSLVNDRLLLTTKKDLARDAIAVDKIPLRVTVE